MLTNEHSDKGQSCKDEFIVTEEEHAEKSEPKAYEEECTPKPWLKWPTQVTINTISTVFIAVFTGTLWVTSCNQLDSMREQTKTMQAQLAEMQSGSADTKAIAESAKTQAEATGRIAEATRSSVAQGKAAMDTTLEALRMDQRAWVGPSNIRIITDRKSVV